MQLLNTPADPQIYQINARAEEEIRCLDNSQPKLATVIVLSSLLGCRQKAERAGLIDIGEMAELFWKSQLLLLTSLKTRTQFLDRAFVITLAAVASLGPRLAAVPLSSSLESVCDATLSFKGSFCEFFEHLYLDVRKILEASEFSTDTTADLAYQSLPLLSTILDHTSGKRTKQDELVLYESSRTQVAEVLKIFGSLNAIEKAKAIRQLTRRSTEPSAHQCNQLCLLRKLVRESFCKSHHSLQASPFNK